MREASTEFSAVQRKLRQNQKRQETRGNTKAAHDPRRAGNTPVARDEGHADLQELNREVVTKAVKPSLVAGGKSDHRDSSGTS